MEIAPLTSADAGELAAFARRRGVVRFGDHLETDPVDAFSAWIGAPDPHARITLAAREGGALVAAARLSMSGRRRKLHVGRIALLADWTDGDGAIDALLEALVDAADRWLALTRLELVVPAGHARVDGVLAARGFEVEVTSEGSVRRDGALADEVTVARVTKGSAPEAEWVPAPAPPPREAPPDLVIRAVEPSDAPSWTRGLSEEAVVWGTLQLPWQRPELWEGRLAANDPRQIFVLGAEIDGEIVAGGVLHADGSVRRRHAAGLGMHVTRSYQGRGVGRRMMEALLELAPRVGFSRVELGVYPDNDRAVRLYRSAGFALEGRQRGSCLREGHLVDDLVMARSIEPA